MNTIIFKMNTIIFSKDRAMQLDLLLRSMKDHFDYGSTTVLYTTSGPEYQKGYDLLKTRFDINLVKESNFKKDLINIVNDYTSPLVVLVDDVVFIREVTIKEYQRMVNGIMFGKVKTGSLMLGMNIDYSYTHERKINNPLKGDYDYYTWDWTQEDRHTNFGYPHGIGGNMWESEYFFKRIKYKRFDNPNELESKLSWPYRKRRLGSPLMSCFKETKLLGLQVNMVQDSVKGNRSGSKYSPRYLNDSYLDGWVISTENIYNIESNAICKEVDFSFKKF